MDYVFWGVVGAGLSTAFLMHFWLPDPPPLARWAVVELFSFVGAVVVAVLGRSVIAGSNPMPGHAIFGALAGALLGASAGVVLGGKRAAGIGR